MRVERELSAFKAALAALREDRTQVGFVPTMGGLHAGHIALVEQCAASCSATVVSLFVNPAQFAPTEDLASYPRTEEADLAMLAAAGADLVFVPSADAVYPPGYGTYVTTSVGDPERNPCAEGASRPTFFRGVATVVTKLLVLVRPDLAYFGRKDAQQCAVVRTLARDLWLDTEILLVDTVREKDGLAMSSRNAYLTGEQREHATLLYEALCDCRKAVEGGERNANSLRELMGGVVAEKEKVLKAKSIPFSLIYVSVCGSGDIAEINGDLPDGQECLACIAGMLGKTRLIDNVVLTTGS